MFPGKSGRDPFSPRNKSSNRSKKKVITTRRFSISRSKQTPSRSRPATYVVPRHHGVPPMVDNEVDAATQRGNIKVVVRVRPPNQRETGPARSLVVQAVDSHIVVFDPVEDNNEFYFHGVKQPNHDYQKRRNRDKKFVFDSVYGPESTNEEIFNGTINPTIDTIISGFNCSVFAYGATGSGKTHTMVGNAETEYGLTYLTVMELYKRLQDLDQEYESDIMISYLEVYNEQVKDLLDESDSDTVLNILETQHGVLIPKLRTHKPKDADHILSLLKYGNSRRSQHPTDQNHESSRSHAVFQVCVTLRGRYTGLTNSYRAAKLVMVDLAGSERGAATGYQGARFREGASINKSLLALGNCINALAEGKKHIPYRDSKLTRILKDALGGNCKTVMIANVSPSDLAYEDSFNTLKYADRAKRIKFNVKKNVLSYSARAAQYAKVVSEMAAQLEYLKGVVLGYENRFKVAKSDAATETEDIPEKINQTLVPSPSIQYDKTFVYSNYNGTGAGSFGEDSFSKNYSNPTYLFQQSLVPSSLCLSYSASNVMKLDSYKKFAKLLDQKVSLESRLNDLLTQLRDVDWKVKQKEIRINGAKTLATNEGFVIKGMERMKKQHDSYLSKKNDYTRKLRLVQDELTAMKKDFVNAEMEFCANKDEKVLISRREFVNFQKLQAEKSLQPNYQSQLQPSFNSMFEELIKSESLLHRSITQLKPRHLVMKHIGHATIENEQEYSDLMADFFCSRIHFALANSNESTLALSPYCDNLNHAPSPTMMSPEYGQPEDETDVTSSTDERY